MHKPRIFLCHANEDKPRVEELYHKLKEAGYHPWLDKYDLLPGQKWWPAIKKILSDPYNLVVVCLSKNSITKRGTVQREIKRALDVLEAMPEETIYLIPARLEPCQVPKQLSDLHWVNLFEPDGFEYLTRSLGFEIGKRQPTPEPEPITPTLHTIEPEMILIPAGEFLMGSNPRRDKYAKDDEQPQHKVYLPDYYIAKTPVTNAQYAAFLKATDHEPPRHWEGGEPLEMKKDHPVGDVSCNSAMAYCNWLAEKTGKPYRLPTEAEWERAARGTDGRIYPWGDEPPDQSRCNFGNKVRGTTPVGRYSPQGDSPYGCVDMAGNVWEWTRSILKNYPYDPEDGREDLTATGRRVLRGGAFFIDQGGVRCAYRRRYDPNVRFNYYIGFRVCVVSWQE